MKTKLCQFYSKNKSFILLIILMITFRSAIADYSAVPTGSMQPTIVEGDIILVNKLAYDLRFPLTHKSLIRHAEPQRGDIIIFDSKVSQLRLVKRVIGVPGDTLEIVNNQLIINDKKLEYYIEGSLPNQPHIDLTENLLGIEHQVRLMPKRGIAANFGPISVPEGYYFAMGDSRDNSVDSRAIGFVPRDEIVGQTNRTLASFDLNNFYKLRAERILHQLQ